MKNKKGDIESSIFVYVVVAILVLIAVILIITYFNKSGTSAMEFIKNIFKFGSG